MMVLIIIIIIIIIINLALRAVFTPSHKYAVDGDVGNASKASRRRTAQSDQVTEFYFLVSIPFLEISPTVNTFLKIEL